MGFHSWYCKMVGIVGAVDWSDGVSASVINEDEQPS